MIEPRLRIAVGLLTGVLSFLATAQSAHSASAIEPLASAAASPATSPPAGNSTSQSGKHQSQPKHPSVSHGPFRSGTPSAETRHAPGAVMGHPPAGSIMTPQPSAHPPFGAGTQGTGNAASAPPNKGPRIVRPPQLDRVPMQPKPVPNVLPKRPVVSSSARPGTEPPLRTEPRPTQKPSWNRNWRNDRHYDWRNWRHRHRSRFHLHFYVDPFGWGYYRYGIGWRMWPAYYASAYWISDPAYYDLPPAPPGTQWIRYYNDALLVDLWTGEVIDTIPDFFW